MAIVHFRKNSIPLHFLRYGDNINEECYRSIFQRFSYQRKMCHTCSGFYGPNFGQPMCSTCHAFLFPEDINQPDGPYFFQEKSDSEDSGNEEPSDFYETLPQRLQKPRVMITLPKVDKLAECISALSSPRKKETFPEGLIENLPVEVLAAVFSHLDDLSLWSCAQVCKRWRQVMETEITEEHWRHYFRRRWPLFKSNFIVSCWKIMYTKLVQSSSCLLCLHQMSAQAVPPLTESSWRTIRLRNELKSLQSDPPEGIEAMPLDKYCCHWQASITGPVDSPYEGGHFFLYLQIPHSYPMRPPVVRFITKIFHPNISRHGDIGIDSIHHNWSLALTISKVLISIQSLLTDPYCHVCMEPDVGRLYQENRAAFDCTARQWTVRYAMHNKRKPSFLERAAFPSESG